MGYTISNLMITFSTYSIEANLILFNFVSALFTGCYLAEVVRLVLETVISRNVHIYQGITRITVANKPLVATSSMTQ